jgi:hypothetical protein
MEQSTVPSLPETAANKVINGPPLPTFNLHQSRLRFPSKPIKPGARTLCATSLLLPCTLAAHTAHAWLASISLICTTRSRQRALLRPSATAALHSVSLPRSDAAGPKQHTTGTSPSRATAPPAGLHPICVAFCWSIAARQESPSQRRQQENHDTSLQHHHRGLRASRPRRTSAAARHRPASARRQIGTTPITGNRAIRCAPLLAFSAFAGQELPGVKLKPHAHCSSSSPLAGACHQKPPEQNTIAACRPSWRHHKNHDVKLELRRCSSSVPRPSASLPEPSAVTMSSSILISGHLSLSTAGELS